MITGEPRGIRWETDGRLWIDNAAGWALGSAEATAEAATAPVRDLAQSNPSRRPTLWTSHRALCLPCVTAKRSLVGTGMARSGRVQAMATSSSPANLLSNAQCVRR